MQCLLPHDASTTCPVGTEPWASIHYQEDVFQTQLGKMLSEKARTGFNPKPYLRNANVQWERADLSNVYVMDFTEEEQRRFALESDDLLMCEGRGNVPRVFFGNRLPAV
jgi:type I restriction enzyme S subunit